MKLIHEQETRRAKDEDRVEPDWSNTLEMLLRKGVKAYGKTTSGKINPQEAGQPRPSF